MTFSKPIENDYATIDGLKTHPLWQQLTDKQKTFVLTYIETEGDRLKSAKTAFDVETDRAAVGMAARLLRNYLVRGVLSAFHGYDIAHSTVGRTELLAIISARLRRTDCPFREFEVLTRMYADIKGWRTNVKPGLKKKVVEEDEEEEQTAPEVTDIFKLVQQLENKKKVGNEEDESTDD
jgi:hypothetical protein